MNGSVSNPDNATSSITIANTAPIGSINTPSPSSTARTWSFSRTRRTER